MCFAGSEGSVFSASFAGSWHREHSLMPGSGTALFAPWQDSQGMFMALWTSANVFPLAAKAKLEAEARTQMRTAFRNRVIEKRTPDF